VVGLQKRQVKARPSVGKALHSHNVISPTYYIRACFEIYIQSLPNASNDIRSTRGAQVQRQDSGVVASALSVGETESPHKIF
jgi:hypothetical protein